VSSCAEGAGEVQDDEQGQQCCCREHRGELHPPRGAGCGRMAVPRAHVVVSVGVTTRFRVRISHARLRSAQGVALGTALEAFNDWSRSGTAADASLAMLGSDVTGAPPAVVATAQFDPLRDEGDAYAAQLAAAGVPVRHLQGPGLIHGWFAFVGVSAAADAQGAAVLSAFDELLGG